MESVSEKAESNCPNYDLLDILFATIDMKVNFGNPTDAITTFMSEKGTNNVYDSIIDLLSGPHVKVDCQFAKILFRSVIELRNQYETFNEYYAWREIHTMLQSTWPTFLEEHPRDQFDYMVINELPGILMEDITPLLDSAYVETYWYSPKATAYLMEIEHLSDDAIEEWPGIHCIYRRNEWIYINRDGNVRITTNLHDIIKDIENYCINVLGIEAGLIVMNPEDIRICFNE